MNTLIIGTGYVGFIQGLVLADKSKKKITFIEKDEVKLSKLVEEQVPHFYEPGLDSLFNKNLKLLRFEKKIAPEFFAKENVVFICVGTPQSESGEANLSFLKSAVAEVVDVIKNLKDVKTTIVIKSTVPPGTTQALINLYSDYSEKIHWAMNPEFLREGVAVADGLNPDRVVIGSESPVAIKMLKKVYHVFKKAEVINCNPTEAELAKYSMNSLLALLISFSNEISQISDRIKNVNPHKILDIVKMDGRWKIGGRLPSIASYLLPGPGYGGSCFPKDVAALVSHSKKLGLEAKIMTQVIDVNRGTGQFASAKVKELVPKKSKITLLGLAFKPDTDDIRESPTLRIINHLIDDYEICVHDPIANLPTEFVGRVELTRDLKKALAESSLAIVITSWKDYLKINDKLAAGMQIPAILDTRGYLKNVSFKKTKYHLLGYNH